MPVRLSLADHFSVPFDQEDELYALFNLPMQRGGKLTAEDGLIADRWHALELAWDCIGARACSVRLDGRMIAQLPLLHVSEAGPCYLRLVATGCGDAAVWVDQVNTFSNAGMY